MSKKFKGKTCTYCQVKPSDCPDHVIAREFFPKQKRKDLPKVPSCEACNAEKSKLEHYAATVFPLASNALDARDYLSNYVKPRLESNLKLKRAIVAGRNPVWVPSRSGALLESTFMFQVEADVIVRLLQWIIKGLYRWHWNTVLPVACEVTISEVNAGGIALFRSNVMGLRARDTVDVTLGDGIFSYQGRRSDDEPAVSVWELSFYNGMNVVGPTESRALQKVYYCGWTQVREDLNTT